MVRYLPNQITMLRLVLAGLFFLLLNQYRYPGGEHGVWWLTAAIATFILAAATDALDGYLARKWHAETRFGRIMDPFCDKVLILGAFIYLAGPRFVMPDAVQAGSFFTMATGVYPWMVAVILARELLVTGVRDDMEKTGHDFGANIYGKLKMILQSIGIPVILGVVALDPAANGQRWLSITRDVLVYTIIVVTLLSGIPYVTSLAKSEKTERA